jgi:hypothetical protein
LAAIDQIIAGVREVLRLTNDVKRLAEEYKAVATELREYDRRLVRLETIVDIAKESKRLRGPSE